MKTLLASTCLAAALFALSGTGARAAACGEVSIAEMNWASAGVAAYVDKIILENGYGCSVSIVAGDTMPTFTSMNEKGQPDMAPELWVNAVRTPLDAAVKEGRLIEAAKILSDGGVEGWWIPKFLSDAHPEIKTVQDALKHPELFPAPEDPSKAAVYNCPSGWNCQISSANLYRALKAEEAGFELVDTGSAAGQEGSIASAFEKKKGWLGYYWAPTPILGKYEMTKLSFGVPNDKAEWDACTAVPDCPKPKVNAYPISDVYTVVTKQFADKAGVAMDYVKARKWDNGTVNKVLAWKDENQATNEDAAKYFLKTYPDMWKGWVKPEVAEKIQSSL
ncbi:ABC transporter substrate-binding protein [Rhizobium rhizosphaerae]|uniref:ABC transporter substrate-binding protein n=1 Tax=Xaviernesmea rhizosphaerae TaxID=1672749 RepID=A0A1Q9AML8_9HYPH|nr:ABC transporter substrate-binding protein [Xaviernesmea rhizosphaerae]OLP56603.1 ABC transporter substrate-binding protein [Xaviernesmea rhizosphaerae]